MVKLASPSKRFKNSEKSIARFTDNKTATLVYYGLILAIIFMSVYVILAVTDGIYNTNTDVVKSNIFILNLIILILLIMTLFMERLTGKKISYARITILIIIIGVSIGSAVELHTLLDTSVLDNDREDTTQFVVSVIGLVFTFMSVFAILIGNIMSLIPM